MMECRSIITLCCLLICLSGSDMQEGHGDIAWEQLMQGEILVEKTDDEQGVPGIRAMFTLRATREELWGMLTDYNHFSRIYGGIDSLRVIQEDDKGATVEFFQTTLFKKIHFVLRRNYIRTGHNLTWESISGDMDYIRGSWVILNSPDDDLKLVIYTNFFRHGGIVPTRITRFWAMGQVRTMAQNARKWIMDSDRLYSEGD